MIDWEKFYDYLGKLHGLKPKYDPGHMAEEMKEVMYAGEKVWMTLTEIDRCTQMFITFTYDLPGGTTI